MNGGFSLSDASLVHDPHAVYAALRGRGGLCPVDAPAPFLVVSRDADVWSILRDHQTWLSRHGPGLAYARPNGVLLSSDPPLHTAQRAMLAPVFRPAAIAAMKKDVGVLTDELMDGITPRGRADLITDVAVPLSLTIVCWMLGIRRDHIRDYWSWVLPLAQGLSYPGGSLDRRVVDAYRSFYLHFNGHIRERRRDLEAGVEVPQDLLTTLMAGGGRYHRATQSELLSFCLFLLVAGSSTTALLIGNLVRRLLEHPEQLARVRADRSLIDAAIEESLRYDSPLHGLFRTSPHRQRVDGTVVPPDTKVLLLFGAANHDPEAWDQPERFDIGRSAQSLRRHHSFGHGIHYCLGAPLARLEVATVLNAILDRWPGLRLDGEPEPVPAELLNGFRHLPLAWDARLTP